MRLQRSGFTLIELLVVLTILSVMGMAAYSMLSSSIRLQSSVKENSQQLEELVRAVNWMQNDIEQFVDRPIRDELGESQPSLVVNDGKLALTHLGWNNPLGEKRSELQRVAYQIVDDHLERQFWRVLDRDQDSQSIKQSFVGVYSFSVAVLSSSGWQDQWPIEQTYLPGEEPENDGPIALRITLQTRNYGSITRLFELPSIQVSQLNRGEP